MIPQEVLQKFNIQGTPEVKQLVTGLINSTYLVNSEPKIVIQKINKMYSDKIITQYLRTFEALKSHSIASPELVQTIDGKYYFHDGQNLWRASKWIDHDNYGYEQIDTDIAYKLGQTFAKLHLALKDVECEPGQKDFHDTKGFLSSLEDVIVNNPFKAAATSFEAQTIINTLNFLIPQIPVKMGIPHGDPKIFNILFKNREVVAVLDFDGMRPGNLYLEIGDALRDWSMREEKFFQKDIFEAALDGFISIDNTIDRKKAALATKIITMELNARFYTDFFNESYFAWDKDKYSSAAEHNLQRTRNGLQYYNDITKQLG